MIRMQCTCRTAALGECMIHGHPFVDDERIRHRLDRIKAHPHVAVHSSIYVEDVEALLAILRPKP